eukprot:7388670-Prymnesium_polylepis.1
MQEQKSVLLLQYCEDLHWHNLVLMGPEAERKAYYWEPMHGATLATRSRIRAAFDDAAPDGWELVSIPLAVQSDGYSCGDWAHYFCCRVMEYVALHDVVSWHAMMYGIGSNNFPEFLQDALVNLKSVRGSEKAAAEKANNQFATKRRDALRTLLRGAARRGVLPWGESRLSDFQMSG